MTQAFNLAQLANNLNTSGQLDATDGLNGLVANANLASSGSASSSTYLRGDRTWAALPALGKILQVVSVFDNTQYTFSAGSSNQTTFYDISGLQLNITPSSTSSRIFLIAMLTGGQATNAFNAFFRYTRNGTNIGAGSTNGYVSGSTATIGWRTAGDATMQIAAPMILVDSPSTTSAINYKIQICNSGGGTYPSYVNRASVLDSTWVQGTASSFTAMEIAP